MDLRLCILRTGNILTETRKDAESGDKSDNESIMMSEQGRKTLILVMSQIMISYLRIF